LEGVDLPEPIFCRKPRELFRPAALRIEAKVDRTDKLEPSKAPRESAIEKWPILTEGVGLEEKLRSGSQVEPWLGLRELGSLWQKFLTSHRRNLRRLEKEERLNSRPCNGDPSS
jgi:hypothetical protein